MHYCRHCQKPTATDRGPCPHCGKELSPKAEALVEELASLDLDTGSPAHAATQPLQPLGRQVDPATGEVMTGASSASREVDLSPEGPDVPIELGFDPLAERAKKTSLPAPPQQAAGEDASSLPAPAPAATAQAASVPGTDEVARVSGYGSPPSSLLNSLKYMLHVRKRRSALKGEIADIEKQLAEANESLSKDLLDVGNRKVDEIDQDAGAYGHELESIHRARGLVEHFRSERAVETQDMKGKESYIDEEISRIQLDADRYKSEQDVLNSEAEDAYAARKRIQLRLQRVDIEIRNIKEQIPRPKKGEPPPDPAVVMPLESKIAGLQEVRRHIAEELHTADEGIKEINRKLAIARNKVSEKMGQIALSNKKKSELLQVRKASDEISQGRFYELQGQLEDQIKALARKALMDDALPEDTEPMKRTLEEKIANVDSITSNLEIHKTAIESYSKQDYMRGHFILGGIAFLSFVLILLILSIIF